MWFELCSFTLLATVCYYRKFLKRKYDKFCQLVRNYRKEEPHTYYLTSLYKSFYLVLKCACVDTYHYFTSVRLSNFIFIKHIHGGNTHVCIIPIVNGPKTGLEYAYIDEVRQDDFVSYLYGVNKDFSNCPECLLEFGNKIRYKFYDKEEMTLIEGNENEDKNKKKHENLKKIKNLLWLS